MTEVFCDRLRLRIPMQHPEIASDRFWSRRLAAHDLAELPGDDDEPQSGDRVMRPFRTIVGPLLGSFAARSSAPNEIELDGSPLKFLQGHNAFGSDDVPALAFEVASRVLHQSWAEDEINRAKLAAARAAGFIGPADKLACSKESLVFAALNAAERARFGAYKIDRVPLRHKPWNRDDLEAMIESLSAHIWSAELRTVDLTTMLDLRTEENALAYLRHLQRHARYEGAHKSMRPMGDSTLYLGSSKSTKGSIKIYAKGPEMRVNRPGAALIRDEIEAEKIARARGEVPASPWYRAVAPHYDDCSEWAAGAVRIELTLKRRDLVELGLLTLADWERANWDRQLSRRMMRRYLEPIRVPEGNMRNIVDELPKKIRGHYQLWRTGEDLRTTLSRATWFRVRSQLRAFGVDIATPPPAELQLSLAPVAPMKVAQLSELLGLRVMDVPDWARGTLAYFEPRTLHPPPPPDKPPLPSKALRALRSSDERDPRH